ncbi:carbohydrate sulfotransferase 1-like [Ptychodera flava]|uniref:carbohydrate sulfotransferase 1-like n=1 Tax=Ptychodera flava TaxID=63121 RepID=UPI003969BF83
MDRSLLRNSGQEKVPAGTHSRDILKFEEVLCERRNRGTEDVTSTSLKGTNGIRERTDTTADGTSTSWMGLLDENVFTTAEVSKTTLRRPTLKRGKNKRWKMWREFDWRPNVQDDQDRGEESPARNTERSAFDTPADNEITSKGKRVNVVVSAGMRTGSSFVGQFFNSHPDFFYLFEPLFGLRRMENGPQMSVDGVRALSKLFNCDFITAGMEEYFTWYNGLYLWQRDDECPLLDIYEAKGCCRTAKNVALKTIRMMDIRDFISLMQDPFIDLKVIILIRDPRAMMASLMPVYQSGYNYDPIIAGMTQDVVNLDETLRDRLKHYCDVNLRNYVLYSNSDVTLAPWKKNLLVLRFEDVASNPHYYADKMYRFIGVPISDDVHQWINNNTKEDASTDDLDDKYGFKNTRDSAKIIGRWRHKMTYDLVQTIQDSGECMRYMYTAGYTPVFSPSSLQNTSRQLYY